MLLASQGPVRFSELLRRSEGGNTITVALRELEADGLQLRAVIRPKPLHMH